MRILGVRQQFVADHSSTSYLFYAEKRLSREARAVVSGMSSHVDVSARAARITYNYSDMSEDRRRGFLEFYDVEVREDYDWWSLSVMLEKERLDEIDLLEYVAEDEASLTFEEIGPRVRLLLSGAHLDYNACYQEFGEDLMEAMAELGLELREELYAGKTDAPAVLKTYCAEDEILPAPERGSTPVGETLRRILDPL